MAERKRVDDEAAFLSATLKPSPQGDCFRLAREKFGASGAALVGKAFRNGLLPEEVREVVEECEYVDELAQGIWTRWK